MATAPRQEVCFVFSLDRLSPVLQRVRSGPRIAAAVNDMHMDTDSLPLSYTPRHIHLDAATEISRWR